MIKQLQTGFKMLRYAYGIKTCMIWCIIGLIVGILAEMQGAEDSFRVSYIGIFSIMLVAVWPLQLLVSMNVPNVVAASPWKKKIQTSVTALLSFVAFLCAYAMIAVLEWIKLSKNVINQEDFTFILIWAAAFAALLMIFMAFSTKYFVVSLVFFIVITSVFGSLITIREYNNSAILHMNFHPAVSILIGVVIIFITAFIEYGVSLLIYKAPISKYSQLNSLRKKM